MTDVADGSWFEPLSLWRRVEQRLAQPRRALGTLLLVALLGAFGAASAVALGARWFSVLWDGDIGFVPFADGRIDPFRATFLGMLLAPLALMAMYLLLGRYYRLPSRPLAAFAVAVSGAIPVYVAGLTMVFMPAILLVISAFVRSCFWWATGARLLLGVAADDSAEFNAISIIGSILLMQFAGGLLAGLT